MEDQPSKSMFKSKTNGFGVVVIALGGAILALPEFEALVEALPAEYLAGGLFGFGIITMVLRKLTKVPAVFKLTK